MAQAVHRARSIDPAHMGCAHLVDGACAAGYVSKDRGIGVEPDFQVEVPFSEWDQQKALSAQDRLWHTTTIAGSAIGGFR
jgi:hypothetical protein